MWFRRRDRVRETAEAIVVGLRSGALATDPPLGRDEGVALPPSNADVEKLSLDLSAVPVAKRAAVVAELREVVRRAVVAEPAPNA